MRLPILMYHKVSAPVGEKADTFLNVSAASFRRQMRILNRLGYEGITLADGIDWLNGGCPLPRQPVCITFDDGYHCVQEHAAPILAKLGWPATVFVPTAYVGAANEWDRDAGRPILPIMGWDELRELRDAGWELAGHTRSHARLAELDDNAAFAEIESGRDALIANLGAEPVTFCYPYGSLHDRTPALVRGAGFSAACTTQSGIARPNTDPFRLPRVKIGYRDDMVGFLYRLLIRPRM